MRDTQHNLETLVILKHGVVYPVFLFLHITGIALDMHFFFLGYVNTVVLVIMTHLCNEHTHIQRFCICLFYCDVNLGMHN